MKVCQDIEHQEIYDLKIHIYELFLEFDEEKLKRVGFKPDRNFDVKVKKRGRSKAGNKEVRKRKMREQVMQKSGHLDRKRQEKAQKFKQEKAKDVLARFMKRDV